MRAAVASLSAPDLRGGARLLWMGSLVAMFLLLWEAPRQPLLVLLVPVVCVGVILAVRSPAWPLGVITGSILISLLLYGHLPKGGTVAAYTAWLLLGLAVTMVRSDRVHPPLRLVLDFSAAGTIALAVLMLARLPASGDYSYGVNKIELFVLIGVLPYIVGIVVGFVRSGSRAVLPRLRRDGRGGGALQLLPARGGHGQPAVLRPLLAGLLDRRDRARGARWARCR